MISAQLHGQVTAWIAGDPDERDRAELSALLEAADPAAAADLADRFAGRLSFGTAGLRGAVGAGPNRMNTATVTAATAGLARWLARDPAAASAGVVIGCDARHRSEEFALTAARVLAGAGIAVTMLPPRQPTPLLAFAVRHLSAGAGVMITASHNPPGDNGYKVYLADGAQLVPPADAQIEAAIAAAGPTASLPLAPDTSPLITQAGDEVAAAYLEAISAATASAVVAGARPLRVVYTPLHGVAGALMLRALAAAGYPEPELVSEQFEPDPEFPTVAYPNPEEPGALDLAIAQARRSAADLIIASDPDGDRLAVAVPDDAAPGGWRQLTGDQAGALIGSFVLRRIQAGDEAGPASPVMASSVVSGSLLERMARAAGVPHARTLTGFKWIVRAADGQPGRRLAYGYEEALGYAVGGAVRDKDGISAALALLHLATGQAAAGATLADAYDALERQHGVHLTAPVTVRTTAAAAVMARLRAAPPAGLAGLTITGVTDYSGAGTGLPATDMLGWQLDGGRVVIRPSGTEPKIKAYLEVTEPAGCGLAPARRVAGERLAALRAAVADLLAG